MGEISVTLVALGLLVVANPDVDVDALTPVGLAAPAFQVKVLPFAIVATKFVGAPFTFGFEQVGTNCGLIGKNAAIEIDGVAYWMGNNGFFSFDGTVNTLPCSVEDFI